MCDGEGEILLYGILRVRVAVGRLDDKGRVTAAVAVNVVEAGCSTRHLRLWSKGD